MVSNWEAHGHIQLMLLTRLFAPLHRVDCPLYFPVCYAVNRVGELLWSHPYSEAQIT